MIEVNANKMPEISNFREYFDGLTDKSKHESLPPDRPKSLKRLSQKSHWL